MKDAALAHLLDKLLSKPTESEAKEFLKTVGRDYLATLTRVAHRLKYERTLSQNALLHVWFGDIAKHDGDKTARDVKGEVHRDIGLTFRLRDEQFNWIWQQTGAKMGPEQQAKFLSSGYLKLSSGMKVKQLKEYMDAIEQEYRPRGVRLTQPKDRENS